MYIQDHMKNGLVLSPVKTIDMACGIADVLSILHDYRIAHRDIKSANIMAFFFVIFFLHVFLTVLNKVRSRFPSQAW